MGQNLDTETDMSANKRTRDELRAAVTRRLERYITGDTLAALEPAATEDAEELDTLLRPEDRDVESRLALGWLHWRRYEQLGDPVIEGRAIRRFTECFSAGTPIQSLPETLHSTLAEESIEIATMLSEHVQTTSDRHMIAHVIELWTRILDHVDDYPRVVALVNLGIVLGLRFATDGKIEDINRAVDHLRQAAGIDGGDSQKSTILSNLLSLLRQRFDHYPTPPDINEIIHLKRQLITLKREIDPAWWNELADLILLLFARWQLAETLEDVEEIVEISRKLIGSTQDSNPELYQWLALLGGGLRTRFGIHGKGADLDESITLQRRALAIAPKSYHLRTQLLTDLAGTLTERFYYYESRDDIDEAVEIRREALATTAIDDSGRSERLSELGETLHTRSDFLSEPQDLVEAISMLRDSLKTAPADDAKKTEQLSNLGNALRFRFQQKRDPGDLDEAIDLLRRALAVTASIRPEYARMQASLGLALHQRFDHGHLQVDLNDAVDAHQAAVTRSGAKNPERPRRLANLARALSSRAAWTGAITDLNRAVEAYRAALAMTPTDHPAGPERQNNLGNMLYIRFLHNGSKVDLDESIDILRQTVTLASGGQTGRAEFEFNLGYALQIRFSQFGDAADLDEAIRRNQSAASAVSADDTNYAAFLTGIGLALTARYKHAGSLTDLNDAIAWHRHAAPTADEASDRAMVLTSLGEALGRRWNHTGHQEDEEEAVRLLRESVKISPPNHPIHASGLSSLGNALLRRFRRAGTAADALAAADCFAQCAALTSAPPSDRINAARNAAELIASTEPARAARLLTGAVDLIREVTLRELERPDQERAVSGLTGLAPNAAALVLENLTMPASERAATAVQLLETGRAVLLSQALDTSSDLTDLTDVHPTLAARFRELRDLLDQPANRVEVPHDHNPEVPMLGRQGPDRHQLASEFADLLKRIRALDGFHLFARPPSTGELLAQAANGPIVVFNTSNYRTDALLVRSSGVKLLPLRDVTMKVLIEKINFFHDALRIARAEDATPEARMAAQGRLTEVLHWLWDAIAEPVLAALQLDRAPGRRTDLPRIWWATGGLLGLLPIHAAGYHSDLHDDPAARTVMARVISSYIPTIRALRHARQRPIPDHGNERVLIVAMPTTPGLPGHGRLHHVADEATAVGRYFPEAETLIESSRDTESVPGERSPTRARVLESLGSYPVAHFACHGKSVTDDPSQSHLLLHDHHTAPLTVASLAPYRLDNVRLAYLSACDTAFSVKAELIDESIHLAAAFSLAGYPHVIGTLWEINDKHAVDIAEDFYRGFTDPDVAADPASALHRAIVAARNKLPKTPSLWAGYVHVGG